MRRWRLRSDIENTISAVQAITQYDRHQVQRNDYEDQEQGGREHDRPGGFHIRALETDVVDVKAEVHELSV